MKGRGKVRRIVLEMIFILTCSLPPPCKRGGSRASSCVLTCFSSLGLAIPYAFLKSTAFYRPFCHSGSAGGLLFLGLKWRSRFIFLGTNCPDGLSLIHYKLAKVTKRPSSKAGWGCSCACEPGWCPVLQSHRVSLSLCPLQLGNVSEWFKA